MHHYLSPYLFSIVLLFMLISLKQSRSPESSHNKMIYDAGQDSKKLFSQ